MNGREVITGRCIIKRDNVTKTIDGRNGPGKREIFRAAATGQQFYVSASRVV